jgi:hypothetical protein
MRVFLAYIHPSAWKGNLELRLSRFLRTSP